MKELAYTQEAKPLVSVIMPSYNAEKYIKEAIESVIAQTYTNWELFVIDDGSTDGSGTILDGYARSDDRIHVFHQENSGQFFAREKGIAMSQGEYILFLDSDDALMPDCLEKLYEVICESKPDMIMFAYRVSYDDGKEDIERDMIFSERKEISPEWLRENLILNNTFNALWTKAFRRELFEGDDTDYSALTGTHFGEDKIRLLYPVTVAKKKSIFPVAFTATTTVRAAQCIGLTHAQLSECYQKKCFLFAMNT